MWLWLRAQSQKKPHNTVHKQSHPQKHTTRRQAMTMTRASWALQSNAEKKKKSLTDLKINRKTIKDNDRERLREAITNLKY